MTIFESIILGIIQGLTEFLPVSSSGHLALLGAYLGVQQEADLSFAVALHAGTVLSTIVVFYKELWELIKGFFRFKKSPEMDFVLKILVSMIPVFIVGFTIKDAIEELFVGSMAIVGVMLIVTGLLLVFTTIKKSGEKPIGYKEAFIIGIAQACAVLPGLSRSGSTISTGLLIGVKRELMAKFSFLMVLIPIIGVTLLDIISGDFSAEGGAGGLNIAVGFASSFIVGLIACRWMIKLVQKGNLRWFAYYCFALGAITIFLSL